MLDPKFLREHLAEAKGNCRLRRVDVDVDGWGKLDAERTGLIQEVEGMRSQRNAHAEHLKKGLEADGDRAALIEEGKRLKDVLNAKEVQLEAIEGAWKNILLQFPNWTHPDAPHGVTDEENKEIRVVGEVATLDQPKDHVQLSQLHGLIDFERGAKVAGAKFYYLKGKMVILEQALIRFALDFVMREGFIPMTTPDVAKDDVIIGTGFQPRGPESQIYSLENSDLSLIGTAEITLGGYHKDEILKAEDLPLRYVGLSHCYRTEAGTYGRESYGLYRVHQFSKVEMFVYALPEQSEVVHQEILAIEERLFQALEIPYRVLDICSGDLGGPAYRKYDLEAWMWGREGGKGGWGEVTSASNCLDFQARRLNVRVKTADGNVYAHTLNGTALALSRAPIALLENHQQPDGSIKIPTALVPYCGFDRIGP